MSNQERTKLTLDEFQHEPMAISTRFKGCHTSYDCRCSFQHLSVFLAGVANLLRQKNLKKNQNKQIKISNNLK